MALRRNSFIVGMLIAAACLSSPAQADDSTITDREDDHRSDYLDNNYIYDYMSRRDSITVGLGDATTSNIIIQHPTPWPSYINNTDIKTSGAQGISALDKMMQSYLSSGGSTSTGTTDTPTSGASVGMSGGN